MDWDDEKYDREELHDHLGELEILRDHSVEDLLVRTTQNTRTGHEFGFKPTEIALGLTSASKTCFYSGFKRMVDRKGLSVLSGEETPSSFWIRFQEECFQIRAFCRGETSLSYRPYECRIPFRDVVPGGVQLRARYNGNRVTVHLSIQSRRPPRYSRYLNKVLRPGILSIDKRHATEADYLDNAEDEKNAGKIYAVGDPRLLVSLGLWPVHRITLDMTVRQYKLLWMCMVRLRLIHLDPEFAHPSASLTLLPVPEWRCALESMEFQPRYLVEGLLSFGSITILEIRDLLNALGRYHTPYRLSILKGLFERTRRGTILNDVTDVARRVTYAENIPTHRVTIRRCLVTPTRCLLYPPTEETSNSLLRDHTQHIDRFLRVQFVDDDGEFPVTGETRIIDDEVQGTEGVFARIRRALSSGIWVAGRLYKFLCFSESQVRERGCWMISECGDFTIGSVLTGIGDLSGERVVAKHAARYSLALSTSRKVDIPLRMVKIDDITRNGYTFTDGVGRFNQTLANKCAKECGHQTASAVQIRIGGNFKGILCVVQDESLQDNECQWRPSQKKFDSDRHVLNVLKVAKFSRATLNRQAILLLEKQGVRAETLLSIFCEEKRKVEGIQDGFDPKRFALISIFPLDAAHKKHIKQDPLVENVTRVIKCRMLSDLKWKAWIEVPKSAFLLGVADETGYLSENEIFCQIQAPHSEAEIVTGKCTIYRNPCLHPGDVRLVDAVDCPPLRHLKNVIVFSTQGQRDLPNMLAGGDLDGDLYSLLWDPRLLITKVAPPMDYTAQIPERSNHPVTIEQIKQHFLDFIKNDVLGRICNAHMALADMRGADDTECLELARLASKAVDFSKSGVPVSENEIPQVPEYPDFMGKDYKAIRIFQRQPMNVYPSEKVLGRMFRTIDPEPVFEEADGAFSGDPRLISLQVSIDYEHYLIAAGQHKAQYEFGLMGLLRRYDITEAECAAGLLLRSPRTRMKLERDFDQREAVREAYTTLLSSALSRVEAFLEQNGVEDQETDRRIWALASYKVTYDRGFSKYLSVDWSQIDLEILDDDEEEYLAGPGKEIESGAFQRLFSFAWLLHDDLLALL